MLADTMLFQFNVVQEERSDTIQQKEELPKVLTRVRNERDEVVSRCRCDIAQTVIKEGSEELKDVAGILCAHDVSSWKWLKA